MSFSRSNLPHLSVLASLLAVGALVGCDANPIGGGSSGSGGAGSGTVVGTGTGTGVGGDEQSSVSSAGGDGSVSVVSTGVVGTSVVGTGVGGGPADGGSIALYGDEIPGSGSGGGSTSVGVGGGGSGFEPDDLFLFISNGDPACSDPFAVDETCQESVTTATIGLPPAYQQPGTYELSDPAIISNFGEWGPDGGGGCMGGGGSFWDGTIQILAIDDQQVSVILAGTSPATLDGPHVIDFCNGGPVDPETNSLAYFPSDLPDPGSGSSGVSTVGTGGGEEKLLIRFTDYGMTCADPYGNQPGPDEVHHDFIVAIPPEYITPGVYDLDDPLIDTSYYEMEQSTAAVSGGGPGRPGTLTIVTVEDDAIELVLEGTQYDFANGGGIVPRCTGE